MSYLAGHKHSATTSKYVHANREHARRVLEAVGGLGESSEGDGADSLPLAVARNSRGPGGTEGFLEESDAAETTIVPTECTRRDLNSHDLRRRNLNPVRLPFRHSCSRFHGAMPSGSYSPGMALSRVMADPVACTSEGKRLRRFNP